MHSLSNHPMFQQMMSLQILKPAEYGHPAFFTTMTTLPPDNPSSLQTPVLVSCLDMSTKPSYEHCDTLCLFVSSFFFFFFFIQDFHFPSTFECPWCASKLQASFYCFYKQVVLCFSFPSIITSFKRSGRGCNHSILRKTFCSQASAYLLILPTNPVFWVLLFCMILNAWHFYLHMTLTNIYTECCS